MTHADFIKKFQYALVIYCEFRLNTWLNGFYLVDNMFVVLNIGENVTHRITIEHINMALNHPNTIGRCHETEIDIINWWNEECVNKDNGISIN